MFWIFFFLFGMLANLFFVINTHNFGEFMAALLLAAACALAALIEIDREFS